MKLAPDLVAEADTRPSGVAYVPLLGFGIWRQKTVARMLGREIRFLLPLGPSIRNGVVLGWGRKRSGRRASHHAAGKQMECCFLEDGFLRSFGAGKSFPPLALVVDSVGIYYDSTRPSALETLLNSESDLLEGISDDVRRAKAAILAARLSKYNYARDWAPPSEQAARRDRPRNVLVVDQTAGDMSVRLGGAGPTTFHAMLAAARAENPDAIIHVKTHPEVSSGGKAGYLTDAVDDASTIVLRDAINPQSLIQHMDRVYVVTSTMGFEALLAGKPVTCFGLPWYAGWGVTDDRQACCRRTRRRTVDELFAAAYFHYARYLNPTTHRPGTIFDVIDWLARQRRMMCASDAPGSLPWVGRRLICVGFRRWKAANLKPMLSLDGSQVSFVPSSEAARRHAPGPADCLVYWGAVPPQGLDQLSQVSGARLVRMEDGFIRSVGLGSDLIRPLSLVLDAEGIYFDPREPSALEDLLNTATFSFHELARAQAVREFIVEHGITKYNVEPRRPAPWRVDNRKVVLVPGQVEDDASIRFGCGEIRTNLALLESARRACPDGFIVYKPHPDVISGNRAGKLALSEASRFADHIETQMSVVSCIEACDEVHTMTSLTGFDALLRGKQVVTYGQPFYAGWGLTEDRMWNGAALARRKRKLHLDELVAGSLLRYPVYWDWELKGYTTCEAALHQIVQARSALEANGALHKLKVGFVRRQWRKLQVLTYAWTHAV